MIIDIVRSKSPLVEINKVNGTTADNVFYLNLDKASEQDKLICSTFFELLNNSCNFVIKNYTEDIALDQVAEDLELDNTSSELDYAAADELTKGIIDAFVILMKNNYMKPEYPI